jgi:acetyltransferase-like isoleucine patch superfamily enzyme
MLNIAQKISGAFDYIWMKWPTIFFGVFVRRCIYKMKLGLCGSKVRFGDNVHINGFHNISIGSNTNFMTGSFLYANDGGLITIGKRGSFNHNIHFGGAGGVLTIGDNVLIGPNVVLRVSDHTFEDSGTLIMDQGHSGGKITVGNDVWLAANVVVTSGVTIGNGVVVGAGSVVTEDLPEMSVCVGAPAKPIKKRTSY